MKIRASSTSIGTTARLSRPAKRRPKRFLRKLVNYLKSDSYMFAPIIWRSSKRKHRPSPREGFHLNRSGFEIEGEDYVEEKKKKRLVELIGEYLRSDSYFYAPLIDGDFFGGAHEKFAAPTSEGATCLKKGVTTIIARTVLTRETAHQHIEDLRDAIAEDQTEQDIDTNHEPDNGSDQKCKQDQIPKQTVFPNCWESLLSEGDLPCNDSIAERVTHRRKIPVE